MGEKAQLLATAAGSALSQDIGHGFRSCRECVVIIAKKEGSLASPESDLSCFDHESGMILEHRKQDLIAQPLLRGIPLNVKIGRVAAGRSVLERVPPPAIFAACNRHVVRHNVQNLPEP